MSHLCVRVGHLSLMLRIMLVGCKDVTVTFLTEGNQVPFK